MPQSTIPSSGLWSSIASIFNGMFDELFGRTGWASYVDTQYTTSGAAFSVIANTDTSLPNNGGTIISSQIPSDVASFYSAGKIVGRNGDALSMQIFFYAIPSAIDQNMDIWIDIGAPIGVLYPQTFSFPKGTGIARGIIYTLPAAYQLNTWQANGGTVKIRSNAALSIYGVTYNFVRTHKAR